MDVYVMKEGRRRGPFQPFRLTEMLEEGELTPQDAVWHEGMENWRPLQETESLQSVLRKSVSRITEPVIADAPPAAPAKPQNPAAPPPEMTAAVLRQRRAMAWRRFFARQIDMTVATVAVTGTSVAAGWTDWWALSHPAPLVLILIPGLVWIFLESVLLTFFGTTPGRLILGMRVVQKDGSPLTGRAALKRSLLVWAGGAGFGLPVNALLPLAQWMYSFWQFQHRGETLWDHSAGTRVAFTQLNRWHAAGVAGITAAFTALYAWIVFTVPLPARLPAAEREQWEKVRRAASESMAPARGNSSLPTGPPA